MASVSNEKMILQGDVSSIESTSSISQRGTLLEEYKKMVLTPMPMVGGKPVFQLASPDYSSLRAGGRKSSPPLPVPEDKIRATVFRAINDYHLSHMNTNYSSHSDLDASLRARREYSNELVRVVIAAREEALRDSVAAAPAATSRL